MQGGLLSAQPSADQMTFEGVSALYDSGTLAASEKESS